MAVTEGHPDKVADAISDSVLDAALSIDNMARVACEVFVTTRLAIVGGERSRLKTVRMLCRVLPKRAVEEYPARRLPSRRSSFARKDRWWTRS